MTNLNEVSFDCLMNVSLEYKTFLWTQQKTGSILALEVFREFGVKCYPIKNDIIDFTKSVISHPHHPCLFKGHENYSMIATIRNPYSSIFSEYSQGKKQVSTEEFRVFLEKKFHSKGRDPFFDDWKRNPDYVLKIENLMEGYSSIPFIKESQYFKSGLLEETINRKPNKNIFDYNWKDYFNKQIADLIYYSTSKYFINFGYHKDSWIK
jgi:hypothetical protein